MKAADVMRHKVVTVTPETGVAEAAQIMLQSYLDATSQPPIEES